MRPKLLFVTITGILTTVIVCSSTLTANAAQTREEAINAQTDMFFYTVNPRSPNIALAETREQSVDSVTDWLFGNLHPELNRRKLRSDEYEYIQEWNVIRQVIDQGGLRYHKVDPNSPGCGEPDWTFPNDDEALRERLANAVFYSRHPERNGEPIRQDETAAIQEWLKLKDSMFVAYC